MVISKYMAVAVSGLVFAGGAALAVGAAAPASAHTVVAAPGQLVSDGCCGRSHRRSHHFNRHHFRHNQRIIVINRNNNFGRSDQFLRRR
ncbi:hypothetical protein [Actinomadura alba]|uniref:Uncharacterized protein n=1 Tax=Actinomadura alba TaxID=406431 RepID=A0ABR7LZT5_9ACTN|nr:hypothetical protein [Actinomadura alba]MBC6470374.1 hypothetical protein [Actinomadura alba]